MAARDETDPLIALARGEVDPLYVLYGAERYLLDRCAQAIRSAVLGDAGASLNLDVFELKESGLDPVLAAARTLPMFGKRRLVVGRGLDHLKSDDLEPLIGYVADPNPTTCLVLTGEKIDGRLRAFQALRKAGYLREFARLRDREIPAWIEREAAGRKIPIDRDAAQALAEAAGADLGRLDQALEQLALFAGPGVRITRAHVEEVISETRERSVFELTRAIGEGKPAHALALLANMLRNREPPLKIQFMLLRQLRQIWRSKEMAAAGASPREIAPAVGVAPFFVDDILQPARRLSTATLARSFRRLYEADRSLKSSRVDAELQIARLVQRLAEDAAPAPRNATSRGR